jgi:dihydroorotate dehydrogenase
MSWLYRHLIRPALFTQRAEAIHDRTMRMLHWASRNRPVAAAMHSFFGAPELPIDLFGLRFPNPVGLAAGMDKRAIGLPAWEALGFGFSELGGVTRHAQPGNPEPRLFRAIAEEAIVNRMGFNNPGADAIANTLAQWRALGRWPSHPVGMNLGKSKITPLENAAEDYAHSVHALQAHVDFFVINVSSPNTPNLRKLQDKAALDEILAAVNEVQSPKPKVQSAADPARPAQPTEKSNLEVQNPKPVLVKVAPDLSFDALDEILELAGPRHIAGIVATNTTISRPNTNNPEAQRVYAETGGLSGRPLAARSTEVVRHLFRQSKGGLPIVGVGGIFTAADAWEKIAAGASLVQVYTGLIYEGPRIARAIVTGLREQLDRQGFQHLSQAVGLSAR